MEMSWPSIVMVPLYKEPRLLFRDQFLRNHDLEQKRVFHRRSKDKSAEEGRRKRKGDYKAALFRKQQRNERDIAMRSKHQSEKLDRINQRFIKSQQELGYSRLNKVNM